MKILNIHNIRTRDADGLADFCRQRIERGEGGFLVPINPIKVIKARRSPSYQKVIDSADWVFPDAWGIKWAASWLFNRKIVVIPGHQAMMRLIEMAYEQGFSVFLLGTRDGILKEAARRLQEQFPGLKIAGMHNGFFRSDGKQRIFQQIQSSGADLVFVAMGEERQEKIIEELRQVYPRAVCQGVGGSIDLVAGVQPMPPAWIIRKKLEWVFRLYKQPFRIPRFRYLPIFAFLVFMEKLKLKLK